MQDSHRDSLWLLAPGLLHYLGNALFAAQGRLQLLGTTPEIGADRAAIHAALERAGGGLCVLRWVLGDESLGPQGLWLVLQRLHDTLRVSLRELGIRMELRGETLARGALVQGASTTRALLASIQQLVHGIGAGLRGTLVVDVVAATPVLSELRLWVQPEQGDLPFPVDLPHCVERLRPQLATDNADVIGAGGGQRPAVVAALARQQ